MIHRLYTILWGLNLIWNWTITVLFLLHLLSLMLNYVSSKTKTTKDDGLVIRLRRYIDKLKKLLIKYKIYPS
jgi:hypothetical protein